MPIVKTGYAYAIIQYHGAPEYKYPTQISDVEKAIAFLKIVIKIIQLILIIIFLSGDSSGGHIALLIALQKKL